MKTTMRTAKKLLPLTIAALLAGGCSSMQSKEAAAPAADDGLREELAQTEQDLNAKAQALQEREQEIARLRSSLDQANTRLASREAQPVPVPPAGASSSADANELLPPNAKPGECYARVFIPPTYRTETEEVLKSAAGERIETIPAEYGWKEETVMVKEASTKLEVVPATYRTVDERIEVKPASSKIVEVPAVYETQTEEILVKPEHTMWKKGKGPITRIDESTGEIMCLVTVPAEYKTVSKRVLVTPATTREVPIPAEYKTITKKVVATPATTRTVEIPAEYKTVKVRTLVRPAGERRIPIPAKYETVSREITVADGHIEWRPILCETNMNDRIGAAIQNALAREGYDPGPIDGRIGPQTMEAVQAYQRAKNLPRGGLTLRTLNSLGIDTKL
ncbi:MAG: peptidoglycan-binding protein [Chromatiales bacterium]|nr:peptidoglycan-binding protein [Chromatiales bacterium]